MKTIYGILILAYALAMVGCQTVHNYTVVQSEFRVLEHGLGKRMTLTIVAHKTFYPILGESGGTVGLLSEAPLRSRSEVEDLLKHAPAHRRFYGPNRLDFNTVAWAVAGTLDEDRVGRPYPIKWIISINPVVIAEGVAQESSDFEYRQYFSLGSHLRLVSSQDLTERAVAIAILDEFPSDPGHLVGDEKNRWLASIQQRTRQIHFQEAMSLESIFNKRTKQKGQD